jgi:hypothetical protein
MQKAKGAVARPDRLEATIAAKLGVVTVDVKVISVGGRVWVRLVGVDEEIGIDQNVARVLLDPSAILIGAVETIEEPRLLGTETIDERTVTVIGGTVDPTSLTAGTDNPVLTQSGPLPVELAIDEDGYVRRLLLEGPLIRADSDDVVRQLDLSEFDQPVTIEAPGA